MSQDKTLMDSYVFLRKQIENAFAMGNIKKACQLTVRIDYEQSEMINRAQEPKGKVG